MCINQGTLALNGSSIQSGTWQLVSNDAVYDGQITGSGIGAIDLTSTPTLTANSTFINQGTVTLGIGSRLTIAPIPGGPLPGLDSIKPVPEPSTLVLLITAGLGLAAAAWRKGCICD
jgi:hypothetical protein